MFADLHAGDTGRDGLERTAGLDAGLGVEGVEVAGTAVEPDEDALFGPALRASRDVSMVLRGEDAVALRAAGVSTVDALAALDPTGEAPVPMAGTSVRDAVLLARAWQRDLTLVRRNRRISVPRADVEVDVDMESFDEAGAYLWGCLLSGSDIGLPRGYQAFATF